MAMFPLNLIVELFLNGTWTDISRFVYERDGIDITGGSANWGDTPQPAQCKITLDNRDGRFTPNNLSGAYSPYVVRNTPIRVGVACNSSSGNFYTGYRFTGEVAEWPPLSDISGKDIYVQIVANGPLRKINSGGGQGSALTRYYASLPGLYAPIAYWPMEEDAEFSDPAGDLVGSDISIGTPMAINSGTPIFKAITAFNGSAPFLVVNNSVLDGLTGSFGSSGDDIFSIPGTYKWVSGVSTVNCKVWGGGGGGANGAIGGGEAGGGGEFAQEATLAVTPGTAYTLVVGVGGRGGAFSASQVNNGANGGVSTFQGDSVLVRAHPGTGGTSTANGVGGTGSTNTVTHPGGAGGGRNSGDIGGGGGGSSGGTGSSGTSGANSSGNFGGGGGIPPAGAGGGGHGGGINQLDGSPGGVPGGGGGSGVFNPFAGGEPGGAGGAGRVELVYTPAAAPPANVVRFIMFVPKHGGNNNRVLVRAVTGGTIARLDVLYQTGGKVYLKGYNSGLTLLFTSSTLTVGDGQAVMVSAELTNSGTSVAYKLTAIIPGANAVIGTVTGTQATASVGSVSECFVGPNSDISKTGIGHLSVQYAVLNIKSVSQALNGHHQELTVDRLIRIANEQALDQEPRYNETSDHWGFESGVQGWAGTNATVARSKATISGVVPWSFVPSGTPLNNSYFIVSTGQAASISLGDIVCSANNPNQKFTVTFIGAPFAGFVNVNIMPMTPAAMDATDTVTQFVNYVPPGTRAEIVPTWPPQTGTSALRCTSAGGAGQWGGISPTGTGGRPILPGDVVSVAADVYNPNASTTLNFVQCGVIWYNSAGTQLSATAGTLDAIPAGTVDTVHLVNAKAPTSTAFFAVTVYDVETVAANVLMDVGNVRVTPRMGWQERKDLRTYLREIKELDQGILRESKALLALGYRTRFTLINQPAAVTLDYSKGTMSPPLAPVVDTQHFVDIITVKRKRGGKHTIFPGFPLVPVGSNPNQVIKRIEQMAASDDAQLAALAQHLLNLGTDVNERYPTVTVIMDRASIPGNAVAPLMSSIASVDIGDRIALINLPFWFPATTASQLVIGYTEHINPSPRDTTPAWTITWNCVSESPWEIVATSIRRW